MFPSREDVLTGLKRFKRLAKQDILASSLTSRPDFWHRQAEVRREEYTALMAWVEHEGVEAAYRRAAERYEALPLRSSSEEPSPEVGGRQQALEMFFHLLGLDQEQMAALREPEANSETEGLSVQRMGS
ncbi:hypothetical protein [Limnochorda pilosa]|uniref:Uncharacterized protein n=1 Tax=Limnochorda pilosa TaxID=1555112 RepID=A0A0K2SKF7_LIMPI|nr:hypothetical protein [Limnochorda pilosa]BAS27598.1 hypothetical protein LIP_1752 [Limnochorda pilosa]